jgi:hypothetical protein
MQTVGGDKPRLQVHLLFKKVEIPGRIENNERGYYQSDQHEHADPQLCECKFLLASWHIYLPRMNRCT